MRPARLQAVATAALIAATAVLFGGVAGFEFITYDDPALLLRNPHVNTGLSVANVAWAFTSTDLLQWAPLTWLTHMVDFELFGAEPAGHHVTSLLFHLFNTFALLVFLHRATGAFWRSAFVATLFALHPLHVEPVAWVSARKDLVSTAWLLVALLAYVGYARRPRLSAYLLTLAAYAASLMAKPMYVTLPVVLLLLDGWPLGRFRSAPATPDASGRRVLARLLLEKIPFLCAAMVSSAVAFLTQAKAEAVVPFELDQLAPRAASVLVGYATYVWKTFWPAKLAVVYPRDAIAPSEVLAAVLLLAAVSALAVRTARTKPHLVVGWLWFVATMLPVIGIVQIGSAWMADKFTYVPLVGLFVMVAWGVPDLVKAPDRPRVRGGLAVAAGAVLALCAARSSAYLAAWRDSITLYGEALEVTEKNFVVLGNLAHAYQERGRLDEALRYFQESIRAEPRYEIGHANIGFLWLYGRGDCDRATPYLATAVQLNPHYQQAKRALAYCRAR